uniref:DUF3387 domain-containing protein n=1 Tax=Steinernema glaseri TaxID=37863 RepID=A0A1I8A698_9BILA
MSWSWPDDYTNDVLTTLIDEIKFRLFDADGDKFTLFNRDSILKGGALTEEQRRKVVHLAVQRFGFPEETAERTVENFSNLRRKLSDTEKARNVKKFVERHKGT